MARKGLSRRLRFEIFKRDGFACRYCGKTPTAEPLHVDHVVPVAEGGTDTPENLVTACQDCNLGKAAVSLDDQKLRSVPPDIVARQREHAEQLRAFLEYEKEIESEKQKVQEMLAQHWEEVVGPLSKEMFNRFRSLQARDPVPVLLEAMNITGVRLGSLGQPYSYYRAVQQQQYFGGVMRRWRENGRFGF